MSDKKREKRLSQKDTIKKVIKYIRRYLFLAVLSLLCAFVSVVTTLYLPLLTGDAVDVMIGRGRVNFADLKEILIQMGFMIGVTYAKKRQKI